MNLLFHVQEKLRHYRLLASQVQVNQPNVEPYTASAYAYFSWYALGCWHVFVRLILLREMRRGSHRMKYFSVVHSLHFFAEFKYPLACASILHVMENFTLLSFRRQMFAQFNFFLSFIATLYHILFAYLFAFGAKKLINATLK